MSEGAAAADRESRAAWRVLALVSLAVVLALTTWFSATAVMPEMEAALGLSPAVAAWLTNAVQIGFVVGAVAASTVNLPDLVRLDRLMAGAALFAALFNAVLLLEPSPAGLLAARTATGFALAGVYPPAMKLVSTWFRKGRGLAIGVLIGALALGSAMPHLFRAVSAHLDWQWVVAAASLSAVAGSLVFGLSAREGPFPFARATFDPRQIGAVMRNRPVRLAIFGYMGHMWELYAMWAWILLFLRAAFDGEGAGDVASASMLSFLVVAAGAAGCVLGGILSDRIGRTAATAGLMAVSGSCALAIGLVFDGPGWALSAIALLWGFAVVADSGQFSTAVTELADPRYVGSALSLQLALGFALAIVLVWLVPWFVDLLGGWRWAFAPLAIGPALGILAMLRLRALPESVGLAGGRR